MKQITMYKGICFGLITLLLFAEVMALFGLVQVSAIGLALMIMVLCVSCYGANKLFARLYKVAVNNESWLITALIMACIIAPSTDPLRLGMAAVAGVIAMASKFIFTWRGAIILNPAAAGIFIAGLSGEVPAFWWVATPHMLWALLPLVGITLYRHQKFQLFSVFFAAAVIVLSINNALSLQDPMSAVLLAAVVSWPLLFLGGVMLTEPSTMPAERYVVFLYAVLVGALATSQLELGPVEMSPILALLIGNIVVAFAAPPFAATLKLVEHTHLGGEMHQFSFSKPRGMRYRAGQYIDVTLQTLKSDFGGNRRRFSLASAPAEDKVQFAMRIPATSPSAYKQSMLALQPGDSVRVAATKGQFLLPHEKSQKLLFIAGGIGITPFRSMLAQLLANGEKRNIVLLQLTSKAQPQLYSELTSAAAEFGLVTHVVDGRLDSQELQSLVPDILDRSAYISGPPAMIASYKKLLRATGIPSRSIHTDSFEGY